MPEERWQEYIKNVYGDKLTEKDLEKMFLANPADAFTIYQLRDHESTHDHRFLSMSQLQAAGLTVERTNYEVVYAGALHHSSGKATPELLNDIFYRFNMERPEDFYGHSLSVSDIVALKVDGAVSVHYVDRYGFQELHGFLSDQPLKNAEMQMEDDYGMIDGIINNGKREPECPSVVEQLQQPVVHKPKPLNKEKARLHLNKKASMAYPTH